MSLAEPTIFERYRLWFIGGGIIVLIGAVLFGFQYCSDWSFKRGVEKDKQKIEEKKAEIAPLEAQREAIDAQINQKKGELTILEQNAAEAEKQLSDAANNSNQALEREANINGQIFNGTSYEEAQRARCAAFPERCK